MCYDVAVIAVVVVHIKQGVIPPVTPVTSYVVSVYSMSSCQTIV